MTDRPHLGSEDPRARQAAEALVDDLQQGWDRRDADLTDRSLADDVMWGSPFGANLAGYAVLHEIHVRMKATRKSPPSRFELGRVMVVAPGIALVHVRRVSLGDDFSELAMYVLVERDGAWWVAGGHHTPVRG